MAQIKVPKNRGYRVGKGKSLDEYNERLAKRAETNRGGNMQTFHPTKGMRVLSGRRLAAQQKIESSMHGWARRAAHIAGSRIGGAPQERVRP